MSQQSAWGPYDPPPHLQSSRGDRRGEANFSRPFNRYTNTNQDYRAGDSHPPPPRRAYSQHDDRSDFHFPDNPYAAAADRGYGDRPAYNERGYSDQGGYSGENGRGDQYHYNPRGRGGEYNPRGREGEYNPRGRTGYNSRGRAEHFTAEKEREIEREKQIENPNYRDAYWEEHCRREAAKSREHALMHAPPPGGYGPPPPGLKQVPRHPPMPPYAGPPPSQQAPQQPKRPDVGGKGPQQSSPISYTRGEHPLKKSATGESPKSPDFMPDFMETQLSPPAQGGPKGLMQQRSHSQDSGSGSSSQHRQQQQQTAAQKYEPPQRRWARRRDTSGSSTGDQDPGDYREYLVKEVAKPGAGWEATTDKEWNVKGPNPADEWKVMGPNPAVSGPWDLEESEIAKKKVYDKAAQEWKENMRIDEPIVLKSDVSGRTSHQPPPQQHQRSPPQHVAGSPGGNGWGNRGAPRGRSSPPPRGRSSPPPRFRQQSYHEEDGHQGEYEHGSSPRGGNGERGGYYHQQQQHQGGYNRDRGGFRDSTASSAGGGWDRGGQQGEKEYWGNNGNTHRGSTSRDWRGDNGDRGEHRRERKVSVESPPVRGGGGGYNNSPPSYPRRTYSEDGAGPRIIEYERKPEDKARDYSQDRVEPVNKEKPREVSKPVVTKPDSKPVVVSKPTGKDDDTQQEEPKKDAIAEAETSLRTKRPDLMVYIPKGRRPPEKPTPKISVCVDPFAPEPKPATPPPATPPAGANNTGPQLSKAASKKKKKKEKAKAETNNKQQQQQQQQQQSKKQQKQKKGTQPQQSQGVNNNNMEGVPDTWEEGEDGEKEGKKNKKPQAQQSDAAGRITAEQAAAAALAKLEERPKKRKTKSSRKKNNQVQLPKSAADKEEEDSNDDKKAHEDVAVDQAIDESITADDKTTDDAAAPTWEEDQEEEAMLVAEDEPSEASSTSDKQDSDPLVDEIMELIDDDNEEEDVSSEPTAADDENNESKPMEDVDNSPEKSAAVIPINGDDDNDNKPTEDTDNSEADKSEVIPVNGEIAETETETETEDPLLNDKQIQLAECAEEAAREEIEEEPVAPPPNMEAVVKPKKRKLKARLAKGGNSNEINRAIVNDLFSESKDKSKEKKEEEKLEEKTEEAGGEEEEDWDAMFDDNGDCLDPSVVEELTAAVGKVKVEKTQFDYYNFRPEEPDMDYSEYSHLIEIFDFPGELQTRDLLMGFKEFQDKGFDIKWVDDTHAIGVFSSSIAARSALALAHPLIKVRPISQASKQTKSKARKSSEFLQPYKPRPETSAQVARNMVAGALGLRNSVPKEKRDEERRKLAAAKEKKKMAAMLSKDAWEGITGKCAMDDV